MALQRAVGNRAFASTLGEGRPSGSVQRYPYDGGDAPGTKQGPACNPVATAEPRDLWERQSISRPFTLFDKQFKSPPIPLEYTTLSFHGGVKMSGSVNAALEAARISGVALDTCKQVNPSGIIDKPKERSFFDPLNPYGLFGSPIVGPMFEQRALVGRGHLSVGANASFEVGLSGNLGVDADLPVVPIPETGLKGEVGFDAKGSLSGVGGVEMDVEFVAQGSKTYLRFVSPATLKITAAGSLSLWAKLALQALGYEMVLWQPRWTKAVSADLFSAELLMHYPFDHEFPNAQTDKAPSAGQPAPLPVTNAISGGGLADWLRGSPDYRHGNHGARALGFNVRTARDALTELLETGTLSGNIPDPRGKRKRPGGQPGTPGSPGAPGPGPAAPTGLTDSDPIPIRWRKGMSMYPQTLRLEVDGEFEDTKRVRRGLPEEKRKYKTFYMNKAGQKLVFDDVEHEIGVSKANLPKVGKIMQVSDNVSRSQSARFRDEIMHPQDLAGLNLGQPDHVQDLVFGGRDSYDNLWPMYSPANMGAGSTNSKQSVEYCETETSPPTRGGVNKLVGRYVEITAVDP